MHIFNWKPDLPDFRDKMFVAPLSAAPYPSTFSMRKLLPTPYDQGDLGSCTANALAASVALQMILEKKLVANNTPKTTPSRLFIYYNERAIEGTVSEDSGAYIRDGIKSLNKQGTCFESDWPYNIRVFTRKPSTLAYKNALPNTVKQYLKINVPDMNAKKAAITTNHAIVFGISVYESFESDNASKTGLIPMPDPSESMLGGHAMAIVGYDDNKVIGKSKGAFEVRNSWGPSWGDKGYCWIPYDYLNNTDLCDDNWIVKFV